MDYPGKVITKTQVTPTQTSASGNWTLDDQAAAIKNNNWPVALVPNPISKSLRFNSADSAYLNRTPASASNRRTWTWSGWVKRGALGSAIYPFLITAYDSSGARETYFNIEGDCLRFAVDNTSSGNIYLIQTTQVFRDPSAWYHIMVVLDTTQATTSDRLKMYVNGTQITAFSTANYPAQNYDATINLNVIHNIGRSARAATYYYDGYMTEVNFIDGQALTPSSFGMTNPQTGQWIPLKYSGTYGTNGFYLNFKDATSTTTLGYDYSGNSNNWTTNNFSVTAGAGNDSLTDVPTPWFAYNTTGDVGGVIRGNYATLNPLANGDFGIATLTNGNLDASGSTNYFPASSTFALNSGMWYWEVLCTTREAGGNYPNIGLWVVDGWNIGSTPYTPSATGGVSTWPNGIVGTPSGNTTYTTWTVNDIVNFAYDANTGKVYIGKNGTWFNSGNPAAGTGFVYQYTAGTTLIPGGSFYSAAATYNFGQRPFAYTPPTGFRSLCTTNLPATAIGFGLTNQGDDYFNAVLYTGNGTSQTIDTGLQPDFIWIKRRNGAAAHTLTDSVRGISKQLFSNLTDAEQTDADSGVTAISSSSITLGDNNLAVGSVNGSGSTYVAWNWKASGSTVSNTAGTITSTVSANTTSGFSIATLTAQSSGTGTFGHGLGVAPSMVIVKQTASAGNWVVYHTSIGNGSYIVLNTTAASVAAASYWNSTSPSSTVVTLGTAWATAGSVVAYCFAAVPGYSAFGSYTGNGSADGPFVFCGFEPRFVLVKCSSSAGEFWRIVDTARSPYNLSSATMNELYPNSSSAESASAGIDILSNGFKIRQSGSGFNGSGVTYIYAAFAESPFQFSNAR
jgi:hypothetical protein